MATNDALIGRALAGRYRLLQRRGVGAHGIVLDAVDEQLQRPVAVKIMLPQFVNSQAQEARFRLEAQVAGSLNHPNLNGVYDWGVEEVEATHVPYLVLEHLSGGSLRDMLDRGRLLSPSQALMVGLDACRGLDYMHKRGVIHRDLKPANLAFGDDRHLRILDVGISRMVSEQTWRNPSAAGIDAARYSSPEQARGGSPQEGTLDSATDIYSLCLVMIEAVTGQVPFSSDSTVATLNARLDKLMPVSADFGPLASVLSRAGSPQASDRYTAADFGRALVQAAEKLPRPGVLPIVVGNGLGDSTGGMRRPGDPTGPLNRPAPTISQPIIPPIPVQDRVPGTSEGDDAGADRTETGDLVDLTTDRDAGPVHAPPVMTADESAASLSADDGNLSEGVVTAAVIAAMSAAGDTEDTELAARDADHDSGDTGLDDPPAGDVEPARRAPDTATIDVLAMVPPKLNIVMAEADALGIPHPPPAPPQLGTPTGSSPPGAPSAPTEFPFPTGDQPPGELSIKLATETRPTSSMPTTVPSAGRPGAPGPAQVRGPDALAGSNAPANGSAGLHISPRLLADNTGETRLYDQSHDDFAVPPRRRARRWIFVVLLLAVAAVAGAFVANRLLADTSYDVPDLVGEAESVARNEISGNDWTVVVRKERSDTQPLGSVIATNPAAGVSLEEGGTIVFVVSDGPTLSVLPDVTGQTLEQATAALAAVNLQIAVGDEVHCESVPIGDELACPDVPAGSVVAWSVPEQPSIAAGTEIMQDTVVSVTLSKGPVPRSVPNLKGLDEATALQTMTALGLTLTRADDIFSDEFAAGIVADQSIAEGTEIQRGESVVYAVSKGRELVAMPTTEGRTYDQLFVAIKAAGLDVGTVTGPTDGSGPLTVVSTGGQPVVSGQMLPKGTVIDLTYTPPPPTTTLPPETTVATTAPA